MIWEKNPVFKGLLAERLPVAGRNYVEWKHQAHTFSGMAAMQQIRVQLTGTDSTSHQPEDLEAVRITPDFMPVLGRTPLRGRAFLPEDTVAGKDQVALVSYAFFERRFAGDARKLGSPIELSGKSYTVIGVLPRDFHLPALFQGFDVRRPDIWLPMSSAFTADDEANRVNYVIARTRVPNSRRMHAGPRVMYCAAEPL